MGLVGEVLALLVAAVVGIFVRRYFIFTSGEKKTNIKFIKNFNLLTGSKDIIFTHGKVLAVNAHDRHAELGDTFGCYFGKNMQVFCRDAELVRKICVTDFEKHSNRYYVDSLSPYMKASLLEARDNDWHTSRNAVGSVLKASKLKQDNVETDIELTVIKMLQSIDKRVELCRSRGSPAVMDVYQINKNFFMQSILKIIYNQDNMVKFDNDYNDVVEEMHNFVNVNYEYIARMCFVIPALSHLVRPLLGFFDHGKYLGLLTLKLEKIIKETLSALKEKRHDQRTQTTIHSLINAYRNQELSKDQLMGNAVFLMLAGFATSVDTMSALMWELAKNQDVQDKLRADLLQYGEKSKFMEDCIDETLRLYPGAMTNRDLGEHVMHKDFRLVKGSCFNISLYSIHRDPRYWGSDAEVWRPSRFESGKEEKKRLAHFIPFGIGNRNCVGYNLAKLELNKFTAQFFLKFKLELCESSPKKLELVALGALPFALPIQGPVNLKLTPVLAA